MQKPVYKTRRLTRESKRKISSLIVAKKKIKYIWGNCFTQAALGTFQFNSMKRSRVAKSTAIFGWDAFLTQGNILSGCPAIRCSIPIYVLDWKKVLEELNVSFVLRTQNQDNDEDMVGLISIAASHICAPKIEKLTDSFLCCFDSFSRWVVYTENRKETDNRTWTFEKWFVPSDSGNCQTGVNRD